MTTAPDPDLAILRSLGGEVRRRRAERGMRREDLAAAAGISGRFLTDVEAGRGNISVANLARLARALDTDPAALLATPRVRHVALLGLRGAGKSTVGRLVARRLRMPLVELDELVEETAGLPLDEIFKVHGEAYFRRIEAQALDQFLARAEPAVLATGGGIVGAPETFERLCRACFTVWLRARPEDHMRRVERQGDYRPMARRPNAMAELRAILGAREPLYAQADLTVDTEKLSPAEAARAVEHAVTTN